VEQICVTEVSPIEVADAVDGLALEQSERQEVTG
jgi:hypothetical protein